MYYLTPRSSFTCLHIKYETDAHRCDLEDPAAGPRRWTLPPLLAHPRNEPAGQGRTEAFIAPTHVPRLRTQSIHQRHGEVLILFTCVICHCRTPLAWSCVLVELELCRLWSWRAMWMLLSTRSAGSHKSQSFDLLQFLGHQKIFYR